MVFDLICCLTLGKMAATVVCVMGGTRSHVKNKEVSPKRNHNVQIESLVQLGSCISQHLNFCVNSTWAVN